jgi:hypothetical protein
MYRNNARAEMQIRKSRINPSWLFGALDKIKFNLDHRSTTSTAMIIRLSDLLSYSLYESDADLVDLQKEFSELQHLLLMEQLDARALVSISVTTSGDFSNRSIAPMSVINKVVEHVNAAPGGGQTICQMNLHFQAGPKMLELFSSTTCGSNQSTHTFTWYLAGKVSRDRQLSGNLKSRYD